jgi:DegV family protein with EDD domain
MTRARVVTDSTAGLSPEECAALGITVLPLYVLVGQERLKEGVDIATEELFRRMRNTSMIPKTAAPEVADFEQVYRELCRGSDEVISLHISGRLSQTVDNAREAADLLLGRCNIAVMDTQSASAGLAILVREAAELAASGMRLDDLVPTLRGLIPRIYMVFFVESLDYLEAGGRVGRAQALLGNMLNIKPLLILEDGEILPLEKVRTRGKAVEKLAEFVSEFPQIEQLNILQEEETEDTEALRELIREHFPKLDMPVVPYGPVLASHVGPGAMGVVVFERGVHPPLPGGARDLHRH